MPAAVALAVALQLDPNNLPIGPKGTLLVQPGQIVETKTGRVMTAFEVAEACKGQKFLFIGENHATSLHQQMEAKLVESLAFAGRTPAVGVEFFHRTKQDVLDQWTKGALNEADFLIQSEWKTQWGYDYNFYRPLFEVIKAKSMPVVGLNVPRDWVRTVSKGGFDSLPLSARMQLPATLDLNNKNHKMVFESLMGGHDMGPAMANIYQSQMLWDHGMADTAAKYIAVRKPTSKDIFVVIAGSGHIMYSQGINYRLAQRGAGRGLNFVMIQSEKTVEVAKGLGDFVYCTTPEPIKK
ncbi:MAG: ChaN family lipoprotein [Armatimonadota bacterium]